MTQEEVIRMEIDNFIKEKERITKEKNKSKDIAKINYCNQKLLMIDEILEAKLERLDKLK